MAVVTTHRRPSDAELDAARDAVIEAARRFKTAAGHDLNVDSLDAIYEWRGIVNAVGYLDVIERSRETHPAVIDGVSIRGWDFEAIVNAIGGELGPCWPNDDLLFHDESCEQCGHRGLHCHNLNLVSSSGIRAVRGLSVCPECGFTYEW